MGASANDSKLFELSEKRAKAALKSKLGLNANIDDLLRNFKVGYQPFYEPRDRKRK